jgi:hypothetical protein
MRNTAYLPVGGSSKPVLDGDTRIHRLSTTTTDL